MQKTETGRLFDSKELSNEDYHAMEGIGGSALSDIYHNCLFSWRYAEKKESKALVDGTAAHTILLESSEFKKRYARGIDPSDYPLALTTNKSMEAWIKDRGRKGYTGKTKDELIEMIKECLLPSEKVDILDEIIEKNNNDNHDKIVLDHAVYDRIEKMRAAVYSDNLYAEKLSAAKCFEYSYIDDCGLKCRWDLITNDGEIWDYKTCRDVHPMLFAKHAYSLGYWLKMALQSDLYEMAFGCKPKKVVLLAQTKTAPYIAQAYYLTDEQLRVGREQYMEAFSAYQLALESGEWANYGGGIQELITPSYAAYENEMAIDEISFVDE